MSKACARFQWQSLYLKMVKMAKFKLPNWGNIGSVFGGEDAEREKKTYIYIYIYIYNIYIYTYNNVYTYHIITIS